MKPEKYVSSNQTSNYLHLSSHIILTYRTLRNLNIQKNNNGRFVSTFTEDEAVNTMLTKPSTELES